MGFEVVGHVVLDCICLARKSLMSCDVMLIDSLFHRLVGYLAAQLILHHGCAAFWCKYLS